MNEPLRVLVVDDDFRVAALHAAALDRQRGCVVVGQATTLAGAQEALAVQPVDLVLADEYLPDGSGSDLIGASDASVLMVTAADSWDMVRRSLAKGAVGYIVKPFAMPLLMERVADYGRFHEAARSDRPVTQADIDDLAALLHTRPRARVPKGRSAVTAKAVAALLRSHEGSMTALAVSQALGISRATAQRYLADLVDDGAVTLSLRYGTQGRPEHSYEWSR
ncbi:putative transcription regulator [Nostocoides japonicum T1-X7]|uniref:Transcriptional regulatory protein n=1 Tax=Nostocoides japonicum T1-X7 TaxID=1194083 RepID=A0A077LTK7_9MICO|nr:response regulator [Tetrasphaera japonica]CCH76591.1 putative transcription regulator [Tetrasphaera japonica T1-X7]